MQTQQPYNRLYVPVTSEPFAGMRGCKHCGAFLYHHSVCLYTNVSARFDPIVGRYVQWIEITPVLEEHLAAPATEDKKE